MSSVASQIEGRSLDQPDETRRPDKATVEVGNLGAHSIGRFTFQPGWTWATSIKPGAGTDHCEKTHVGVCTSGKLHVWMTDGSDLQIEPGHAYVIPPGHDAEVVGDEAFVGYEFSSASTYAK